MKVKYKVFSNLYQDSVSLMQISAQISKLPGIQQASVVMGTPNNLEQLRDAGLGNEINASPNDLVIAVMGEEDICNEALILAQQRLTSKPDDETDSGIKTPEKVSLEMALEAEPEANLALISVPGDYAAAEAIKALNLGMNVMMFSDNVSIVQEKSIKTLARERQRIVMGPDCGTAIVNGIPLGFANVVKRGAIGVIGASGTGLQEVTCRIDQLGAGISQALGTGGHDLSEEIGGISMLFALDALAQDDETRVIVLISKPPSPIVARTILERAEACGKPVVVNFLGANPHDLARPNITAATTLASAADIAWRYRMFSHFRLSKPMYPATISQCYKTPASACQPIARRYAVFSPEEPSATKRNLSANKRDSAQLPIRQLRVIVLWQISGKAKITR